MVPPSLRQSPIEPVPDTQDSLLLRRSNPLIVPVRVPRPLLSTIALGRVVPSGRVAVTVCFHGLIAPRDDTRGMKTQTPG